MNSIVRQAITSLQTIRATDAYIVVVCTREGKVGGIVKA